MSYIYSLVDDVMETYQTRCPYEICEALGIRVISVTHLEQLAGALTYIMVNGKPIPVIFVNDSLQPQMHREVVGHELGHYLLGHDTTKRGIIESGSIYDTMDKTEYQANVFLAHLLIDDEEMLALLQEGRDVFETAMLLEVTPSLLNAKMTDLNRMGYQFPVSWGDSRVFE